MFTEALLIGLLAGLAGVDMFNGLTHFHRPVVVGPLVGLILGDVHTGLLVGGTLELVWMVPLAGAQSPNVVIGGIIGTAFAILTHADAKIAVGIAVPFAIAMQGCITLLFTLFSPLMHHCDRLVSRGDWRGIERINYLGLTILFLFYLVVAFLPVYFGADAASAMVAGGMMPAIGFSLLMKIMLKQHYVAYFILGFLGVTFLKLPTIAIALGALSIALIDFFNSTRQGAPTAAQEESEDGI